MMLMIHSSDNSSEDSSSDKSTSKLRSSAISFPITFASITDSSQLAEFRQNSSDRGRQSFSVEPNRFGQSLCNSLPAFHAFTGCDYSASFYGKGKATPFNIFEKKQKCQKVSESLVDPSNIFDEDAIDAVQEFTCLMYCYFFDFFYLTFK